MTAQVLPVLEVEGVSKSFPGVRALEEVGFELRPGEVHALLGENGAGKSTLIKILCGVYRPDAGTIRLGGEPVRVTSPRHAQALGIAVVHQELALEPYLSVAENVFLGRQPVGRFGLIDRRRMREETSRLLGRLGVAIDPDTPLGELPVASRQLVAIARAVSSSARVLVFDEPTTSLTQHESDLLFAAIRRLRADGIGIVYVSHRMQEIFDLCDRVTILRDGRRIATMPVAETDLAGLIGMMIGREMGALLRAEAGSKGRPVLEARASERRGVLHGHQPGTPRGRDRRHGRPRGCRPDRGGPRPLRRSCHRFRRDPGRGRAGAGALAPGRGPGRDRAGTRGPQGAGPRDGTLGAAEPGHAVLAQARTVRDSSAQAPNADSPRSMCAASPSARPRSLRRSGT